MVSKIRRLSDIFTVEGHTSIGWETDAAPQRKKVGKKDKLPQSKSDDVKSPPNLSPYYKHDQRSRLLLKNGGYNFVGKNIPKRGLSFFYDFWNTLIDLPWHYVALLFFISLISFWLFFAIIFYLIAMLNGDLAEELPPGFNHCFVNFINFGSAFLYSIETMHTIGYGYRYPTDNCSSAILFMCVSALFGTVLEALIVGIVFAKFQMPAHRAQTLMFSNKAVISVRDGELCFLFRVGNMRKSLIIQLMVRAHLVRHRVTLEGELMPFHQQELIMTLDSMSGNAFSSWPVTACHKIGSDSPLYDVSQRMLPSQKFEIIVTLEGIVENTGSVVQARTSFIPSEIVWGYSFPRLLTFRKEKGEYVVDFNQFQTLEPVDNMPFNSAHELEERRKSFSDNIPVTHMIPSSSQADIVPVVEQRVREMFKPPSPSLALAVSNLSRGSIRNMEKNFESNVRRFSRVITDDIDVAALQKLKRQSSKIFHEMVELNSLREEPSNSSEEDLVEEMANEVTQF